MHEWPFSGSGVKKALYVPICEALLVKLWGGDFLRRLGQLTSDEKIELSALCKKTKIYASYSH